MTVRNLSQVNLIVCESLTVLKGQIVLFNTGIQVSLDELFPLRLR